MVWHSIQKRELLMEDPLLFEDLRDFILDAQAQINPDDGPHSDHFVLRGDTNDLDAVYIHVGSFTPLATDRFTLRLLRFGDAEVKPRGVAAGYLAGQFTAAESAIMARALDSMSQRSEALLGVHDAPLPGLPLFINFDAGFDSDDDMDHEDEANNHHQLVAMPA